MTAPEILVHARREDVGVVVVEGLGAATDALCVVTADDSDVRRTLREAVPLAQKAARADLGPGETLIEVICRTANGRLTAAETSGHREFAATQLYRSA